MQIGKTHWQILKDTMGPYNVIFPTWKNLTANINSFMPNFEYKDNGIICSLEDSLNIHIQRIFHQVKDNIDLQQTNWKQNSMQNLIGMKRAVAVKFGQNTYDFHKMFLIHFLLSKIS